MDTASPAVSPGGGGDNRRDPEQQVTCGTLLAVGWGSAFVILGCRGRRGRPGGGRRPAHAGRMQRCATSSKGGRRRALACALRPPVPGSGQSSRGPVLAPSCDEVSDRAARLRPQPFGHAPIDRLDTSACLHHHRTVERASRAGRPGLRRLARQQLRSCLPTGGGGKPSPGDPGGPGRAPREARRSRSAPAPDAGIGRSRNDLANAPQHAGTIGESEIRATPKPIGCRFDPTAGVVPDSPAAGRRSSRRHSHEEMHRGIAPRAQARKILEQKAEQFEKPLRAPHALPSPRGWTNQARRTQRLPVLEAQTGAAHRRALLMPPPWPGDASSSAAAGCARD